MDLHGLNNIDIKYKLTGIFCIRNRKHNYLLIRIVMFTSNKSDLLTEHKEIFFYVNTLNKKFFTSTDFDRLIYECE